MMNFYDLDAWKEARILTKLVYACTRKFPSRENFGLSSQMQRAAVSVMANLAEGFGRVSIKEKLNFYNLSQGSLTELQSHVFVAADLSYLDKSSEKEVFLLARKIQNIIHGLMRSTKKRLK